MILPVFARWSSDEIPAVLTMSLLCPEREADRRNIANKISMKFFIKESIKLDANETFI
jgi:hypothetical protein